MKKLLLLPILFFFLQANAQHTFSIVAVDTATGEVGSAGASCVNGFSVNIIAYLLPGTGAINTQAWWQLSNKTFAAQLMQQGYSPQEIMDTLALDDRGTDSRDERWRQYGAVDLFNGGARAAAYTGDSADDWKGHIVGPNYAIQGNILLGPQILDSMETRFLNTPGDLADKLMAALQGAKVPGADTRCLSAGTSSTGSYIQVARPGDLPGNFYLNLNVPPLPSGNEPIDSLQSKYDEWKTATGLTAPISEPAQLTLYPNPSDGLINFSMANERDHVQNGTFILLNLEGMEVFRQDRLDTRKPLELPSSLSKGIYLYRFRVQGRHALNGKLVIK